MWTKALHSSNFNNSSTNTSKMVDPDLTWQTLQVLQKNGSTAAAARPSSRDDALDTSNGIIPGEQRKPAKDGVACVVERPCQQLEGSKFDPSFLRPSHIRCVFEQDTSPLLLMGCG
ncbi:uncharacterized protein sb:cb288 isoform X1 [Entelurus aequoreus]|uniref:uncharacterized protein sb:cb288 isoform X1 n=1 Tax=Entelurus aequoreus TaxID=161455 RepID=UPI002B1E58C3|nr:uncharacterized protein sb:cb288 isoform X1 [Entelurus aequoreus]